MSWGIIIKDVFVSGVSLAGIDKEIEELKDVLRMYEDELICLTAASARDVKREDGLIAWEEYAPQKTREALAELKETTNRLHLLYIAKESECEED